MNAFRTAFQPYTKNLPLPVRNLGVSIFGETCYNDIVLEFNFESTECIKLAISKGLGIGIIAASSVVKVPQMVKLIKSQSASGLSLLSYILETLSYLISLTYNVRHRFPFSTFGETGIILLQNIIIAVLIFHYSSKATGAALFVAGLATTAYVLFDPNILNLKALGFLQATAGALGSASKLPQILTIWNEGGTGQLSAFTVFTFLLGSLARVFTTLQEVDDKLILYGYISGFCLNVVLGFQMMYYWNNSSHGTRKEKLSSAPEFSKLAPRGKISSNRRRG